MCILRMTVQYVRTRHTERLRLRINSQLVALGSKGATQAKRAHSDAEALLAEHAALHGLRVLRTDLTVNCDAKGYSWTKSATLTTVPAGGAL